MYNTSDIHSLTDFNRKSAEHIKRIQETGRPEILTVQGKAAAVVLAPETFDRLAQAAEYAETLETIRQSMAQHEAGQAKPVQQAFDEMREELKADFPDASF